MYGSIAYGSVPYGTADGVGSGSAYYSTVAIVVEPVVNASGYFDITSWSAIQVQPSVGIYSVVGYATAVSFRPDIAISVTSDMPAHGVIATDVSPVFSGTGVGHVICDVSANVSPTVNIASINTVILSAAVTVRTSMTATCMQPNIGVVTATVSPSVAVVGNSVNIGGISATVRAVFSATGKGGVAGPVAAMLQPTVAVSGACGRSAEVAATLYPVVYTTGKIGVAGQIGAIVLPSVSASGGVLSILTGAVDVTIPQSVSIRGLYGSEQEYSDVVYVRSRTNQVWART